MKEITSIARWVGEVENCVVIEVLMSSKKCIFNAGGDDGVDKDLWQNASSLGLFSCVPQTRHKPRMAVSHLETKVVVVMRIS